MRLTKSFIDRVSAPNKNTNGTHTQRFYRDSALPGFALRITSAGTRSFVVERKYNGRNRRLTIGQYGVYTVEDARREAQQLLANMAQGVDPSEKQHRDRANHITLQGAFDDYLLDRKDLRHTTIHDYERHLKEGLKDWKNKRLIDISKDMVSKRHLILGRRSHARANNAMRFLRAIFNHAMAKYEDQDGQPFITVNPVIRLNQTRAWYKIGRRQTLVKSYDLAAWFQATEALNSEVARDYLQLLLYTGLRRSEASNLTWDNVDFRDRTLTIPVTKNHQAHTLPLSTPLFDLLRQREANASSNYVFPGKAPKTALHDPRTAMQRVTEISGVKFTLHDLRRTFITLAESLDIPAYALKQLLNHKDPNDVTAGYIIFNIDRLRGPMEQISKQIQHFANPDPKAPVIELNHFRAQQ